MAMNNKDPLINGVPTSIFATIGAMILFRWKFSTGRLNMDWLRKLVLPLVKNLISSEIGKLDDLVKPQVVAILVKSEPFKSNPAQADALAQAVIDVVITEVQVLINKI